MCPLWHHDVLFIAYHCCLRLHLAVIMTHEARASGPYSGLDSIILQSIRVASHECLYFECRRYIVRKLHML